MREPLSEQKFLKIVCVKRSADSKNQSLCLSFYIIWDIAVEDWMMEVRPVSSLTYLLQTVFVGFCIVYGYVCVCEFIVHY